MGLLLTCVFVTGTDEINRDWELIWKNYEEVLDHLFGIIPRVSKEVEDWVLKRVMAEYDLQWAAIERLPTFERLRSSLFDNNGDVGGAENKGKRVIDVSKLGAQERHLFVEKLIKHIEHDNLHLLRKIKNRIDK